MKLSLVILSVATMAAQSFVIPTGLTNTLSRSIMYSSEEGSASEAVFVPPSEEAVDEDAAFAKAELLGRGSAKVSPYYH
jgi:hypothetical protein